MANNSISGVPMTVSLATTPATQTFHPATEGIVRIHGAASSIRPAGGSSSVGRVIPVPSQVSASSSSTGEEEKEFIHFIHQTLKTESNLGGEVYKEPLKNRLSNVQGKLNYLNEQGEFRDGKFYGQGIYTSPSGTVYEGYFKEGKCHGPGTITYTSGMIYVGEFKDGKFDGKGKLTYSEKEFYDGEFKNGKFDGQGTYSFADGKVYVGKFKNGKCHGPGTITYPNQDVYVGEFRSGMFYGKGRLTKSNGKVYYDARFENDSMTQGCCIQ